MAAHGKREEAEPGRPSSNAQLRGARPRRDQREQLLAEIQEPESELGQVIMRNRHNGGADEAPVSRLTPGPCSGISERPMPIAFREAPGRATTLIHLAISL